MHLVRLACYFCAKRFDVPKPAADRILKSGRVLCVYCARLPQAQPAPPPAQLLPPPSPPG
jgi:hypothetical protein